MSTAVKLTCKYEYRNATVHYRAGADIEVSEQEAAWLNRDAPGVFEPYVKPVEKPVEEPTEEALEKAIEEPPVDKMLKSAPMKKGRR